MTSVAEQPALIDLVLPRKIRRAGRRQPDFAHCRCSTTFSGHPTGSIITSELAVRVRLPVFRD
jgi:hypothetical protein